MITIVNYKMGNIRSIKNAFEYLGIQVQISNSPDVIANSEKLILPGVGSFRVAMENICHMNLRAALDEAVLDRKTPILGICLGMQLLAKEGTEDGLTQGLGWIPGNVERFYFHDPLIRIPHIGFNSVHFKNKVDPLWEGLNNPSDFYFVHSFHFVCEDKYVTGYTNYNSNFVSSVQHNHIIGTQFHPEKSQANGLILLKNFANMRLQC
jgi:glutamine amidotransferase